MPDTRDDSRFQHRVQQMKAARKVFVQTLGLNLLVSFTKLICGFMTNTLSMIADGFHSLLDASSNIIGIVGITIAVKPADEGHPYGHRKFEALAATVISFIMFVACLNILSQAGERIFFNRGEHPSVSGASYSVMLLSLIVNVFVTLFERKKGREFESRLLEADSQHTLSDIYVSIGVIVAILAAQYQVYWIDLVASLTIVILIFSAGFRILTTHLGTLVDAAILDPALVEKLVGEVPGVISCHKIRSRGIEDHIFVDLHVQVRGDLTVEQGHQIAYAVEEKLKQAAQVTDVMVHIEEPHELS